jgi:hypothetical protein
MDQFSTLVEMTMGTGEPGSAPRAAPGSPAHAEAAAALQTLRDSRSAWQDVAAVVLGAIAAARAGERYLIPIPCG